MANKAQRDVLLYSDTAKSADVLYFGRVEMHDPFVALGVRGRKVAVVSALEFGRVRRTSDFDVILRLEACAERAGRAWPRRRPGAATVIAVVARELRARILTVPADFPASLYLELRGLGVRLEIADGMLFPERETKTEDEARAIREGNRCSAAGIAAAERVLRAAPSRASA
jgi:Xaa-Pro aminopeptidase